MAINAAPIRITPTSAPTIMDADGPIFAAMDAYCAAAFSSPATARSGIRLMQDRSTDDTKTVNAARYLPSTMPVIETGAVSRSCSVRILRSSANERMVRSGKRMTNAKIM